MDGAKRFLRQVRIIHDFRRIATFEHIVYWTSPDRAKPIPGELEFL
jgi:hypothetical protein